MLALNVNADELNGLDQDYAAQDPGTKANGAAPPDRLRLVPPSEMDWRRARLNLVKGLLDFGMMARCIGRFERRFAFASRSVRWQTFKHSDHFAGPR